MHCLETLKRLNAGKATISRKLTAFYPKEIGGVGINKPRTHRTVQVLVDGARARAFEREPRRRGE